MTVGSALGVVGGSVAITGSVFAVIARSVERTSPVGVLRRLRASPDGYTVRVRSLDRAWAPGGGPSNDVVGPGTATYRLETTGEGEVVSLTFVPAEGTPPRHTSGPVTERLGRLADRTDRGRWVASGAWIPLLQLALGGLGIVVGLAVTAGHSENARGAGVILGFVAGAAVPMFAGLAFASGRAAWTTFRANSPRRR